MPNYSSLTRREQVLERLRAADGGWVDGVELSNEVVGGSEGLKRLRELRQAEFGGYDIRMRQKPGADQFQYRLPLKEVGPGLVDQSVTATSEPARKDYGSFPANDYWAGVPPAKPVPTPEPAEKYDYTPPPLRPKTKTRLGRTMDGNFVVVHDDEPPELPDMPIEEIQAPGQLSMGVEPQPVTRFDKLPTSLDLGLHRRCPICQGYRRPVYETDELGHVIKYAVGRKGALKPHIIGYEEFCRDPRKGHKDDPCERCNGIGVVPA